MKLALFLKPFSSDRSGTETRVLGKIYIYLSQTQRCPLETSEGREILISMHAYSGALMTSKSNNILLNRVKDWMPNVTVLHNHLALSWFARPDCAPMFSMALLALFEGEV